MTDNNLFYCYSNRLNKFLDLFGFNFVDKGCNQNGQEFKAYKRTEDLDFALQHWKAMKNRFSYEKVGKKSVNL